MILDVKVGNNFQRKARLASGDHTTEAPEYITYDSVVSCDSVRIALPIESLNVSKVLSCDTYNAYLTAPCHEKVWTIAGTEFGSYSGKVIIIVRALYGLNSS